MDETTGVAASMSKTKGGARRKGTSRHGASGGTHPASGPSDTAAGPAASTKSALDRSKVMQSAPTTTAGGGLTKSRDGAQA